MPLIWMIIQRMKSSLTLSCTGGGCFPPPQTEILLGWNFFYYKITPIIIDFSWFIYAHRMVKKFFWKISYFWHTGPFLVNFRPKLAIFDDFCWKWVQNLSPWEFFSRVFCLFFTWNLVTTYMTRVGYVLPQIFGVYVHFRRGGGKHPPHATQGILYAMFNRVNQLFCSN